MEPLRLTVYATSNRPANAQCSGTRCVRLPIGAGPQLSARTGLYGKESFSVPF